MVERRADRPRPIVLGADKAHGAESFVRELRAMNASLVPAGSRFNAFHLLGCKVLTNWVGRSTHSSVVGSRRSAPTTLMSSDDFVREDAAMKAPGVMETRNGADL